MTSVPMISREAAQDESDGRNDVRPHSWKNLPAVKPELTTSLLRWYADHGRSFPWRDDVSPYHLLCAEVMLQRTRAESVRSTYERFVEEFSRPIELVEAGRETADSIFEELGLMWRAEHFWKMNRTLVSSYDGDIPESRNELLELPGVGHYVASAVRVFAFGLSETVIDSNVLRVFGRYLGIEFSKSARRSRRVAEWAASLAPEESRACRRFNWALLDHGALVCRARSPRCGKCPLADDCWFYREKSRG